MTGAVDEVIPRPIRASGSLKPCSESMGRFRSCFTRGGSALAVASGKHVAVYHATTRALLLKLEAHTDTVTAITLHPVTEHLITAALDGSICEWDAETGHVLRRRHVGYPILRLQALNDDSLAALVEMPSGKHKKKHAVHRVPLEGDTVSFSRESELIRLGSSIWQEYKDASTDIVSLAVGPQGAYVLSASMTHVKVWNKRTNTVQKHYIGHHDAHVTSIDFHPYEPYFACGLSSGKLMLWYRFEADTPVTSLLHWHAHGIRDILFSRDGTYLYSVGEEAVLVVWQLDTGHRQFLPRNGFALNSITASPNGHTIALGCADNAVRLVDNVAFRPSGRLAGRISADHHPLGPHTQSNHLCIGTSTSLLVYQQPHTHLQELDPSSGQEIASIPLLKRNYIPRTDPVRVSCMAFHENRLVVAMHKCDGEQMLQFWAKSQTWKLETVAMRPHANETIVDLALHGPTCISVSRNGTIQSWRATQGQWVAHAIAQYKTEDASQVTLSPDGSLVAIAFTSTLVMMDSDTLESIHAIPMHDVTTMGWVHTSMFAVCSATQVVVWDNVATKHVHQRTFDAIWSVAFVPQTQSMFILTPSALYTCSSNLEWTSSPYSPPAGAVLAVCSQSGSPRVYVSSATTFHCLSGDVDMPALTAEENTSNGLVAAEHDITRPVRLPSSAGIKRARPSTDAINAVFSTPSYLAPAVSTIGDMITKQILHVNKKQRTTGQLFAAAPKVQFNHVESMNPKQSLQAPKDMSRLVQRLSQPIPAQAQRLQ